MKAIITQAEVVGKQKNWMKVSATNVETGESVSGVVPIEKYSKNVSLTLLKEDFENDSMVDMSGNGQMLSVEPLQNVAKE